MKSKEKLLKHSQVYAIIDHKVLGKASLIGLAARIKAAGPDLVQFRDKTSNRGEILKSAQILRRIFKDTQTLFIVNDYLDVAKITDSDGVHLGQEDCSVKLARMILGKGKIIGVSCHSLAQAIAAQKAGADYIGLGPIFSTPTKPQYGAIGTGIIRKIERTVKIPIFAIGGIDLKTIQGVKAAGAKRVAVCRSIIKAKNISKVLKNFRRTLTYINS